MHGENLRKFTETRARASEARPRASIVVFVNLRPAVKKDTISWVFAIFVQIPSPSSSLFGGGGGCGCGCGVRFCAQLTGESYYSTS